MIPNDPLWAEALAAIDHLPALALCYRLGELAAWQHNKMADTGVCSAAKGNRVQDARNRVEEIAVYANDDDNRHEGNEARRAFAGGYDAAIDFGCNADCRLKSENRPTTRTDDELLRDELTALHRRLYREAGRAYNVAKCGRDLPAELKRDIEKLAVLAYKICEGVASFMEEATS